MKVIAVMPAYQEASRVKEAVFACQPHVDQVIVVDDGSNDETGERASEAGAMVLRHGVNRGQGAALKTGTIAALRLGAQIIVHIDADGQHDPTFLPTLFEPIRSGTHDIVFGSRFLGIPAVGMPRSRWVVLKIGRFFNTYILGIPSNVTDPQAGLRAMNAHAARQLNFSQDGYAHCSEILRLATRDLRWKEIPVAVRYTDDSLEKGQKATNAIRIVWELFIGSLRR